MDRIELVEARMIVGRHREGMKWLQWKLNKGVEPPGNVDAIDKEDVTLFLACCAASRRSRSPTLERMANGMDDRHRESSSWCSSYSSMWPPRFRSQGVPPCPEGSVAGRPYGPSGGCRRCSPTFDDHRSR